MEAVILAGGKGTRLRPAVSGVPKPIAPVGGVPFIMYPLGLLARGGVKRVIISVGYMGEKIIDAVGGSFGDTRITYCEEDTPLGTGGAMRKALRMCSEDSVIVLNGDTFFDADLSALIKFHAGRNADITVALKEMRNFDRYGAVVCEDGIITDFREKQRTELGYINGGLYCVRRDIFDEAELPESFSFESDFLLKRTGEMKLCGLPFEGSFTDIGVPDDYMRAQMLLPGRSSPSLCRYCR